jgi:hypothetical protein
MIDCILYYLRGELRGGFHIFGALLGFIEVVA